MTFDSWSRALFRIEELLDGNLPESARDALEEAANVLSAEIEAACPRPRPQKRDETMRRIPPPHIVEKFEAEVIGGECVVVRVEGGPIEAINSAQALALLRSGGVCSVGVRLPDPDAEDFLMWDFIEGRERHAINLR